MMTRMQITLRAEEQRRARARAAELGVSFAEYIRRLIARDLGETTTTPEVDAIFDLGTSSGSDVAANKDAYLGAALVVSR